MLQLLGSVMIIFGVLGIGYGYIEKENKILCVIETWEHIMQMFISEITYKKQPLSLASNEVGEKIGGKEGICLKRISERMQERIRESFFTIWQEECLKYCKEEKVPEEEMRLIQEFGRLTGFEDEEIQKRMIEGQREKWKNLRLRKQEEYQERKRLILILSSCMGLMIVLILW